jgi:hypothetical protein
MPPISYRTSSRLRNNPALRNWSILMMVFSVVISTPGCGAIMVMGSKVDTPSAGCSATSVGSDFKSPQAGVTRARTNQHKQTKATGFF